MHPRFFIFSLFMYSAQAFAADSLCTQGEKVVFSCVAGNGAKIVSMCASPGLTQGYGALYYRFGTPSKIEMEYPKKPHGSARRFKYAHYTRAGVARTEVAFEVGKYSYTVFDYFEETEKPDVQRGVRIVTEGDAQREATLMCKAAAVSNLHQLDGMVPCNSESALAQCN